MTSEKAQALQDHISALAAILYEETKQEQLTILESLEKTVRQQVLEHPLDWCFFIKRGTGTTAGCTSHINCCLGVATCNTKSSNLQSEYF